MPILKKASKRFDPARTLVVGFLIIITVGMLLLCLPISSKARTFTPLLDCLFTSTSSACVTGFAVADTYTHWSLFGQIV
ncbi:MAG: Trk family potassium uptake protein, partial [Oscillospiraceae bacterium]|nr:Trk family potassium uptake protein [Oscillospiraceae bacterium]